MSIFSSNRGSALLTTILLVSVLLILGVGFHRLIVRSIRLEYNAIEAGKAYFHAEAATESALLEVFNHAPGYENSVQGDIDADAVFDYRYAIKALSSSGGTSVPCDFDPPQEKPWKALHLNESFIVPLFRENAFELNGSGKTDIHDFILEYFLSSWPANVQVTDKLYALRWKVIGLKGTVTQSMSGFVPVSLGIESFSSSDTSDKTTAHFLDCSSGICISSESETIYGFLTKHENNFFVVTNVLDVSSEKDLGAPLDDFVLNVRFIEDASAQADKRPLVCDMVRIEADGASYDINASASSSAYFQNLSIDTELQKFLPVFHFALYRTKS